MTAPAICDVVGIEPGDHCTSRAAAIVTTGCIHEHLGEGPICQTHIEELAHQFLTCGNCKTCSDPHLCTITALKIEALP